VLIRSANEPNGNQLHKGVVIVTCN